MKKEGFDKSETQEVTFMTIWQSYYIGDIRYRFTFDYPESETAEDVKTHGYIYSLEIEKLK